ncbi:uncharacterized protein MONBRDRAFT_35972 [Monosiga brevicollis MX1]|uniref:Rap-GAP domain-containing protein n=1 Tax=Monosiga brevicollis TaxID=81824 RepID=A9UR42_MONBE|nr:uncharacterized protein MONBRDRAFT_35972 [Monosiga brevicollis MX1]EDQ92184.1 predicted protein [Monosiga brevicollis MX1]|eukprot:XP_001743470.1 hypothetical protein [Monosiga brevicollis MX1]
MSSVGTRSGSNRDSTSSPVIGEQPIAHPPATPTTGPAMTPAPASTYLVHDGSGGPDLITLLSVTQSNRLNDQRSRATPPINLTLTPTDIGWCINRQQLFRPPRQRIPRIFPMGNIGNGLQSADPGARFFRDQFLGQDHITYLGRTESLGAIAVSLRREAVAILESEESGQLTRLRRTVHYRAIVRTTKNGVTRLLIPESEILPSNSLNELDTDRFESKATPNTKSNQPHKYKFGVLYQAKDQSTEAHMYNNRGGSDAYESFLRTIAHRVTLRGFTGFAGGLDVAGAHRRMPAWCLQDSWRPTFLLALFQPHGCCFLLPPVTTENQTGTKTFYTPFQGCEVMLHVATELPFSEDDEQQVLRKRHIGTVSTSPCPCLCVLLLADPTQRNICWVRRVLGNDIVTVVFQEEDAAPFDPASFSSHYQHVFILVRVKNANTPEMRYHIAVVRKGDVCTVLPDLPPDATFDMEAIASGEFKQFLLRKAINMERACYVAGQFLKLASRTRSMMLDNLVQQYSSELVVASFVRKGSLAKLMSMGRRKPEGFYLQYIGDNPLFTLKIRDENTKLQEPTSSWLAFLPTMILVVRESTQAMIHQIPYDTVIGWSRLQDGLRLWYNRNESASDILCEGSDYETIVATLKGRSGGTAIISVMLTRDHGLQPWGFELLDKKIVTVAPNSPAALAGLRTGQSIFRLNDFSPLSIPSERLARVADFHSRQLHVLLFGGPEDKDTVMRQYEPQEETAAERLPSVLKQLERTPRAGRGVRPSTDSIGSSPQAFAVYPRTEGAVPARVPGKARMWSSDALLSAISDASNYVEQRSTPVRLQRGSSHGDSLSARSVDEVPQSPNDTMVEVEASQDMQLKLNGMQTLLEQMKMRYQILLQRHDAVVHENVQLRQQLQTVLQSEPALSRGDSRSSINSPLRPRTRTPSVSGSPGALANSTSQHSLQRMLLEQQHNSSTRMKLDSMFSTSV